jgi:hypothetical protein
MIRLAHANPELRPHLLPLLKKTAGHSANDIGPALIRLVGEQLGYGNAWQRGANFEVIGDDILAFIRGPGRILISNALKPVIEQIKDEWETAANDGWTP